jgi:hypothetical protein
LPASFSFTKSSAPIPLAAFVFHPAKYFAVYCPEVIIMDWRQECASNRWGAVSPEIFHLAACCFNCFRLRPDKPHLKTGFLDTPGNRVGKIKYDNVILLKLIFYICPYSLIKLFYG